MPAIPNKGTDISWHNVGPSASIAGVHTPVTPTNSTDSATDHDGQTITGMKLTRDFMIRHKNVKFWDSDTNGYRLISQDNNITASCEARWSKIVAPNGGHNQGARVANLDVVRCEVAGYRDLLMSRYGYLNIIETLMHSPFDTYEHYSGQYGLYKSHPDGIQINHNDGGKFAERNHGFIERCKIFNWPWPNQDTGPDGTLSPRDPLKTASNSPAYWGDTDTGNSQLAATSGIAIIKPEGSNTSHGTRYYIIVDCDIDVGVSDNGLYVVSTQLASGRYNEGVVCAYNIIRGRGRRSGSADGLGFCKDRLISATSGQPLQWGGNVDQNGDLIPAITAAKVTAPPPKDQLPSWFDTHPEIVTGPGGEDPDGGDPESPAMSITSPAAEVTAMESGTLEFRGTVADTTAWNYLRFYIEGGDLGERVWLDKDQVTAAAPGVDLTVTADGVTFTRRDGAAPETHPPGDYVLVLVGEHKTQSPWPEVEHAITLGDTTEDPVTAVKVDFAAYLTAHIPLRVDSSTGGIPKEYVFTDYIKEPIAYRRIAVLIDRRNRRLCVATGPDTYKYQGD